ncbi:hypothetical protein, partial [Phocaeicola sartorii]|uniref:hypothetical protein n=1 Tax=Phocaeicola sartorii TaxID=671267 RepID=UPI0025A560AD
GDYDKNYFSLRGDLDTIEKLNCHEFGQFGVNNQDIAIYLFKDLVDPIEEINWDKNTNPFEYIINQQYYEVSPNPNAATTLYTDYNITSSKIITADNITTMRSDLNLVSNTVDVVSVDVDNLDKSVEGLKSRMALTEQITEKLEADIDKIRLRQNIQMVAGMLAFSANGLIFGAEKITSCVSGLWKQFVQSRQEMELPDLSRSIGVSLNSVRNWCESGPTEIPV